MKVAFLTLGCKVNYYETEKMMADFEAAGFEIVEFSELADVYIINTCTVTNIADRKSRQMIHRAKKKNPESFVVAVGCYVESGREEIAKEKAIDAAYSNAEKSQLAQKVLEHFEMVALEKQAESSHKKKEKWDRTRKYIKIQDGCNQFCSYCMIPYVRGKGVLTSKPEEEVLQEVRMAAEQGYKEVVLTGIHLSSYGVDWTNEKQFVALKGAPLIHILEQVNEIQGIERIRLGSLEPRIICREFMDGLQRITKCCPHFHLSLQSGCDATLKRMNRHYTAAEYKEKCDMIREYYEHPAITTDVIVGFPEESEEEFAATRAFLQDIKLADIHVFPYSMRNGTVAAKMENQVSPEVKNHRSEILRQDTELGKNEFEKYFIGKKEKILFEEEREFHGQKYLVGHNERYVLMGIPAKQANEMGIHENDIKLVEITVENLPILYYNSSN